MIQPKHSPKEALEKIKLMMKYDTSKTLNENKQVISEDVDWGRAGTSAAVTGGAAGAAALTGALIPGSALMTTGGALSATGVGTILSGGAASTLGAGATAALGAGVIAGAAALALTPLIYWLVTKDNARSKVTKALNYCKTESVKIAKLERGVDDRTIRDLSDQLHDAMEGLGTDEQKITEAFKSLKTASDLCALVDRFNKDWSGEDGDLMEWLDSDIDTDTDWNKIYIPIRNVVEDSLLSIKDEKQKKIVRQIQNKQNVVAVLYHLNLLKQVNLLLVLEHIILTVLQM
jgi:hypothetical protein